MNNILLGYLLTILSAAAFASTSLFLKIGFDLGMNAWSYTLLHSFFSLVLLGGMYLRERRPAIAVGRPSVGLAAGFTLAGAGAAIAFNVSLAYLSISLGTILLFTYPALVAVGAWLVLGQRPTKLHLAALALTLAGAVLTTDLADLTTGMVSLLGVVLALAAAVAHAMYLVLGERIGLGLTPTETTALTRGGMFLGVIAIRPTVLGELAALPWQAWALCAGAALLTGVTPFFFLTRGISLIGANRAAIVSVVELPIALALGLIFAGDIISPPQWVGATLITLAVIVSQLQPSKGEESPHGSGAGTA